tara:strand:- start:780 stop:980 length:201 start_codon:yes stop_codon:yes gene_type:complete
LLVVLLHLVELVIFEVEIVLLIFNLEFSCEVLILLLNGELLGELEPFIFLSLLLNLACELFVLLKF